jgi:hypothetical protein
MRAGMSRLAVVVLVIVPVLVLAPPLAAAGQSRSYHTIVSVHGFASVTQDDGCLRTEVYVSSSDARYAAQPGPVTTQGLTALAVRVIDTCARARAAAGGDGLVLFDGMGMVLETPLQARPQLGRASVTAAIPLDDDVSGRTVGADLRVRWAGAGPLSHDTGHSHVRFPLAGIVNGHGNTWQRPATAEVTVDVDGVVSLTATASDAVLERVRSGCLEIRWPHYTGDSNWCFGFPA